jgi:hypothetical protein
MNKKPQFVNYIDSALENSISSITPISTDIIDFITLFDSENRNTRATLVASKSTRVKKDIKRFLDFSQVNEVAIRSYGNKKSLLNLPKGVRVVSFKG